MSKFKIILSICAIIVSFSFLYYLVIRPAQKDYRYNQCLQKTWQGDGDNYSKVKWAEICIKQYK